MTTHSSVGRGVAVHALPVVGERGELIGIVSRRDLLAGFSRSDHEIRADVIAAARASGVPLAEQRVVVFGAGTAGIGIADLIRDAMVREGLSGEQAISRFWCLGRHGLLVGGMESGMRDF